jgi:hypothetical protein
MGIVLAIFAVVISLTGLSWQLSEISKQLKRIADSQDPRSANRNPPAALQDQLDNRFAEVNRRFDIWIDYSATLAGRVSNLEDRP